MLLAVTFPKVINWIDCEKLGLEGNQLMFSNDISPKLLIGSVVRN